jgi:plasmid stabilization system protein ParE
MKIEWTNPAVSDLQYIRDYIARDSEFFAHRFAQRIIDTIGTLPQFPELYLKLKTKIFASSYSKITVSFIEWNKNASSF